MRRGTRGSEEGSHGCKGRGIGIGDRAVVGCKGLEMRGWSQAYGGGVFRVWQ